MTEPRLIDADVVCIAAENTLRDHIAEVIELLGRNVTVGREKKYEPPRTWKQLPALEAMVDVPAFPSASGAISSPGLAEPPVRRGFETYDATWRLTVGVFGRGRDYEETQRRIRHWAAHVRATLLRYPDLGNGANSLTWVGEGTRQIPQKNAARTLAGCAVDFDVTYRNVVLLPPADLGPVIESANTSITIRQPQE